MIKTALILGSTLLMLTTLSGCVAEPYPYYGGSAPYYGTTIAPAYAYGEVGGTYYPPHRSQHIYSNYNANYWHHQRSVAQASHGAPQRSTPERGGAAHEGSPHR